MPPTAVTSGGDAAARRLAGWYGWTVYVWGPLLLLLTLVGVLGLLVRRRFVGEERSVLPSRAVIFLVLATALGLLAAPAVTAQFVWRYQLPFVVLVPVAAALAVVRVWPVSPELSLSRAPTDRTAE